MGNSKTTWEMSFLMAPLLFTLFGLFNVLQAQENFITIGSISNGSRFGEYGFWETASMS